MNEVQDQEWLKEIFNVTLGEMLHLMGALQTWNWSHEQVRKKLRYERELKKVATELFHYAGQLLPIRGPNGIKIIRTHERPGNPGLD